jgi:hypothetical protein
MKVEEVETVGDAYTLLMGEVLKNLTGQAKDAWLKAFLAEGDRVYEMLRRLDDDEDDSAG